MQYLTIVFGTIGPLSNIREKTIRGRKSRGERVWACDLHVLSDGADTWHFTAWQLL